MMFNILQVATVLLVTLALVPSLAHALELPGKLRLDKAAYLTVQPIYYPGFTAAGVGEPVGIIATVVLLWLTPGDTPGFWLTLVALLGLIAMHAVYWIVTHPVNKFWLQQENLGGFGSGFFSFGANQSGPSAEARPWTALRDRWEYSHVARAGFACVSLIALLIAVSDGS
jgi:hypothetical protein